MKKHIFYISLIFTALLWQACNPLQKAKEGGSLTFNDTLFFDTVFTQVGSTTRLIKIYNNNNFPIKIDKIFLAGGKNSAFRLNIDGIAATQATNLFIDAKDSMFVFAEVTINPQKSDLIVDDSIIFVSGTNRQRLVLEAVGLDVHLINGEMLQTQTWTNDKPYLIYNSVMVDTDQTLTINAGTTIYLHNHSYFLVAGKLIVNGTKDKPVTMKGDRIDDDYYKDKPGQWNGLAFLPGSHDNYINYLNLSEGFFGINADSAVDMSQTNVFINNSTIEHCSYIGLLGHNTTMTVLNSVIADCGVHNVGLFDGGNYQFFHCTIQNDYNYTVRKSPAVGIKNYIKVGNTLIYTGFISAVFVNSIIYGNLDNEFVVAAYDTTNSLSFSVRNCLMKLDLSVYDTSSTLFQNVIVNKDPKYADLANFDYHLTSQSPAIGKADYEIDNTNAPVLQYDIDGTDRLTDGKTDIGAYEFADSSQ